MKTYKTNKRNIKDIIYSDLLYNYKYYNYVYYSYIQDIIKSTLQDLKNYDVLTLDQIHKHIKENYI